MSDKAQAPPSYEFMDPWWQTLQAHGVRPFRARFSVQERRDGHGLSIDLEPRDTATSKPIVEQCRALRDALELVFLQSIVDRGAFMARIKNQVQDQWSRHWKHRVPDEEELFPCHVGIDGSGKQSSLWIRNVISTLLTPEPLHQRDHAFQAARRQLMTGADPRAVRETLKISIGFDSEVVAVVHELATFLHTGPPPAVDYPFCSVVVDFLNTTAAIPDQQLTDIATCLADKHNRVRLGYMGLRADLGAEEAKYGSLLSTCLRLRDSGETDPHAGADVHVATPASHRLATQLCSAVMFARGANALAIEWSARGGHLSRRDQVRLMRWITLSLFSSQASHSIEQLRLEHFFVDESDCDDLQAFVLGSNRLDVLRGDSEELTGQSEATASSRDQVFLAEGTNLQLNPVATRPVATSKWKIIQLGYDCWVDVLDADAADQEYWEVLVPAYGLCRVRRTDALSHRTIAKTQDVGGLASHGIKSLTLDWMPRRTRRLAGDYPGLCRFLHLVGAPLEELSVSRVETFLPFLEAAWTACPLLTRLKIRGVPADFLSRISDAFYEAGKCHVSSLTVIDLRLGASQELARFCEKLSDPERQMSRTLSTLSLRLHWQDRAMADQAVASMGTMLDRNAKLVSFSVGGNFTRSEQLSVVRAKHNTRLPGQAVPLAVTAKLAFLSAVDISRSSAIELKPRRGLSLLDSDVIGRIFKMAARPVKRKVVLTDGY